MQHVQGEERNQLQIFCLEQMVASDSFVRVIDLFVDSIDLASFGFKHITFKEEGRPPYHPNHLENEKLGYTCHIHKATERYILANRKPEGFAVKTKQYYTLKGAIHCLVHDCNITGLQTEQDLPKLF
jgi:hypothetical protein